MDFLKAVHVMSTRVTTWSDDCTAFAEATLGYIKQWLMICLVQDARKGPKCLKDWRPDLSADADHRVPKCYSGSILTVSPTNCNLNDDVFLTLDFGSTGQKYVKLSPAESEVVCAVWAMRFALRYCESWHALGDRNAYHDGSQGTGAGPDIPIWAVLRQREDNTACIQMLERGWSAALTYVCSVYGVSCLWAAERIKEGRVELVHEGTKTMMADPLTKLTKADVLYNRGVLRELTALFVKAFQ